MISEGTGSKPGETVLVAAEALGADQVIATDDDDAMGKLPAVDAVAVAVAGKIAEMLLSKVKAGGVLATVVGPQGGHRQGVAAGVIAAARMDGSRRARLVMAARRNFAGSCQDGE